MGVRIVKVRRYTRSGNRGHNVRGYLKASYVRPRVRSVGPKNMKNFKRRAARLSAGSKAHAPKKSAKRRDMAKKGDTLDVSRHPGSLPGGTPTERTRRRRAAAKKTRAVAPRHRIAQVGAGQAALLKAEKAARANRKARKKPVPKKRPRVMSPSEASASSFNANPSLYPRSGGPRF